MQPQRHPPCCPPRTCSSASTPDRRPDSCPDHRDPARPGPAPACSDAELLAIAQVRHLLGRRSEAGFLAEVARDWAHLSRTCRTKARPTAASAGCGARSSSCAATSPDKSRPMTASRSTLARCRSGTPRGSAAPTAGPGPAACMPGSAATPRTPNGSTASASRSGRWQPQRPRPEHRARRHQRARRGQ